MKILPYLFNSGICVQNEQVILSTIQLHYIFHFVMQSFVKEVNSYLILNRAKFKNIFFHVGIVMCELRNKSRMRGSMLILTWVGIIFVIILHRF